MLSIFPLHLGLDLNPTLNSAFTDILALNLIGYLEKKERGDVY